MEWELTAGEMRVLASLMEKQATTPDQYPLSINALIQACNQKSNRDPVMQLSEPDVRVIVNDLMRRRLVRHASGYGGRVSRYEHRLTGSRDAALDLGAEAGALLCLLLLRGAQTPGELRARGQRLANFPDIASVEAALRELEGHADGPLVAALPREPGRRESRYMHALGAGMPPTAADSGIGETASPGWQTRPAGDHDSASLQARVEALERAVVELRELLQSK